MKKFNIPVIVMLSSTVLVLLGFIIGKDIYDRRQCNSNLVLINSDLRCSKQYIISKEEYTDVESNIKDYFTQKENNKVVSRYSVYFRDLDNGPTFGINSTDDFVPASLLKLPMLLTYYRLADDNTDILSDELKFDWEQNPNDKQYYKPSQSAEPGKTYTISELLYDMIAYSDNNSYLVLRQHLVDLYPKDDQLSDTFKDLAIVDPKSINDETIDTKSYASIFRNLYEASYLSKNYSEKALELLTQSDFKNGLKSGVPEDIKIAHKFGERSDLPGNQVELHDCGVIYFPGNPYLLCVMLEGSDFPNLANTIRDVSKMIYDEVNSRKL